jgi:hypothetical protein
MAVFFWMRTGPIPAESQFVIAPGASARAVAEALTQNKLLPHPWAFLIWFKVDSAARLRQSLF